MPLVCPLLLLVPACYDVTTPQAYHQGWDLWGENKARIMAAAEFHASLMSDTPAPFHQPAPSWLTCTGAVATTNPDNAVRALAAINTAHAHPPGAGTNSNTVARAPKQYYPSGVGVIASNGSTFDVIHHHFHTRLGLPMPNTSALLSKSRPLKCWDHMCWETLTHGGAFQE
jgi:hypothetical protein